MRNTVRTCLFLAIALSGITQAGVVGSHGALKVKGNRIVDASGNPIQVAGMSMFWSGWMSKYWNSGVVNTLVKDWNSSLIRAAMGIEGSGNYLGPKDAKDTRTDDQIKQANKDMVKTVVDAAIANDIYVIIDWHDHNATQHTAQAVAFFGEMSQKYKNDPHVIYELFNEPLQIPWSDIKTYAQAVTTEIRKNSDNLIVVGTPSWSQNVDDAASSPLPDTNTAYTLHFYAGTHALAPNTDPKKGPSLGDRARTALSKGIALFITEWGTSDASGGGTNKAIYTPESDAWLAFAKSNGLSWANWSVADKDESSAALKPGASSNGSWTDANISPSGLYVKGKIAEVTAAIGTGGGTVDPPVTKIDTLQVPGRIEAEKADTLSTDIKIETTTDDGGGSGLGYTTNGSATYTVKVANAGNYTLRSRVATAETGTLTFKLDNNQIGTLSVATTGGWQSWATKEIPVQLNSAGAARLQVSWTGAVNLNWLEFVSGQISVKSSSRFKSALSARSNSAGIQLAIPEGSGELVVTDLQGRIRHRQILAGERELQVPVSSSSVLVVRVSTPEGPRLVTIAPAR